VRSRLTGSEGFSCNSCNGVFCCFSQEEAELKSDGTRSTIKPSQFAVARLSLIRE